MGLDDIMRDVGEEVLEAKRRVNVFELQRRAARQPPPLDFRGVLEAPGVQLIAEVKRASPSAGAIAPDLDAAVLAQTYAGAGAVAVSVLTEPRHFLGSLEALAEVRRAVPETPLLRKDFIFDPYQVYEARAFGADALLLIVAVLEPEQVAHLLRLASRLEMAALVEVHDEAEVETALAAGAEVVGINNRDLNTFAVDLATTERLRPRIPAGVTVVSESGVSTREDVERLAACGVDAVLVGGALVTAPDVAAKVRELTTVGSVR